MTTGLLLGMADTKGSRTRVRLIEWMLELIQTSGYGGAGPTSGVDRAAAATVRELVDRPDEARVMA